MFQLRFATFNMTACFLAIFLLLATACATNGKTKDDAALENVEIEEPIAVPETDELTLVFAGDVMAHKPNYANGNFNKIWEDIKDFVSDSDLAFANIEAPVNDDIDWNTYPQFNMHSEYVKAAIDCGFNVFSLSNNHTNDHFLKGIKGTKKYFEDLEKKSGDERKIYACGLKDKENGPLTYRIIEKKGWKILFVAVTELLNRPDAKGHIDYYPTSDKNHDFLISEMKRLKEKNDCDLSIISIHTDEPEYIREITKSHETFFKNLIEKADCDIVWANHPHIVKPYKNVSNGFVMYANGNTISAQRTNPNYDNPSSDRDNTGDGLILKVKVDKKKNFEILPPYIITTYIDPNGIFVIRHLDEDFIHSFERLNYKVKANYFKKRLKINENILKQE